MQDFFIFVYMRTSLRLAISLVIAVIFYSCTVQEDFHFNKDLSGHYSFKFDYSAILEFDTSGTANREMDKGYIEMEDELKKIEGISNIIILSDKERGTVLVSYDFANIEALNQANYNKETDRYDKLFSVDGKKVAFRSDFANQLQEYEDEDMNSDDLLSSVESMLDYKMTFTFENKIKVLKQNNFEQHDDYSLTFKLDSAGLVNPTSFMLKVK